MERKRKVNEKAKGRRVSSGWGGGIEKDKREENRKLTTAFLK